MQSRFTTLGTAHRRYNDGRQFGIAQPDRLMHQILIGQTGTGKSSLMANMAKQDAEQGNGFCLIDPHGDLAAALSTHLGKPHVYWNVADPECAYGYNPLTATSAALRPLVTSGLIETLKQQWADAWGARMEHLLRFAILALLEQPKTDLRDVVPLFLNKTFREQITNRLTDPQVVHFWREEYKAMNYKTSMDGVAPIANKIGAFLAHPLVRQAVCEPELPLRFRRLMDEGQCVIVNLAKGQLGADTANVLGGLLVSSIMNAAFSRHGMPEQKRKPFFLYVDEFPSFSTVALANALSETRKYALGLVMGFQHTAQADPDVLHSIIGNAGTIMVFRIGALDTPLFIRQLEDVTHHDLVHQANYSAFTQLMVRGQKSKTFTAETFPPFYV